MSETDNWDNVLAIDVDKYIDWYKNECVQSAIKEWLQYELWSINHLRTQTNYDCKTYNNEQIALKYKTRINEIYIKRVKEYNDFRQSIYDKTEWLIPTLEMWETFEKSINKNPYIFELDRLLELCKDTKEAKERAIQKFKENLKTKTIKNIKSIENAKVIELDFFDKKRYYANENPEYMGYCQEQAYFSLIYDCYTIKAFDYANELLQNLSKNIDIPNNKELTQKQIALLCYYMKSAGIFHTNKIGQDATDQCIFICGIFNIKITGKIQDSNFYKYWNSIQSVNDSKNVITQKNLEAVLDYCKELKNNALTNIIKKDIDK